MKSPAGDVEIDIKSSRGFEEDNFSRSHPYHSLLSLSNTLKDTCANTMTEPNTLVSVPTTTVVSDGASTKLAPELEMPKDQYTFSPPNGML